MPNVHKNPAITPRPPAELRDRAKLAVTEVGTDLNAWVIGALEWLVHDRPEMPPRPAKPIPKA